MLNNESCYRVRFKEDTRDMCIIEAEAPIDVEKLRSFIRKTRRVFHLADDAEIFVIEERRLIQRRDVTGEIFGTKRSGKFATILSALDARDNGELTPLESFRQASKAIGWDDEENRLA